MPLQFVLEAGVRVLQLEVHHVAGPCRHSCKLSTVLSHTKKNQASATGIYTTTAIIAPAKLRKFCHHQ